MSGSASRKLAAVNTARKYPAEHLAEFKFKPGISPNPTGRPKGSRSKLGEAFLVDLQADFVEHGAEAIKKLRETDVAAYVRVVASVLPKEFDLKTKDPLAEISDEELDATIQYLRARMIAEGYDPDSLN